MSMSTFWAIWFEAIQSMNIIRKILKPFRNSWIKLASTTPNVTEIPLRQNIRKAACNTHSNAREEAVLSINIKAKSVPYTAIAKHTDMLITHTLKN